MGFHRTGGGGRWGAPGDTGARGWDDEGVRHLYRCPLRWADLDLLGHINNVVYVDYMQEARVDMLRLHAPDSRAADLAEGVVVVRHEVTYLAPLHYRAEPVSIECWVTEIRAASFTMAYEIFDETPEGRVVYLRATTLLTPYVFADERPRRLRPEEREVLTGFLEPAEPRERPRWSQGIGSHENDHLQPTAVRFSDVDVYGHVNNVEYFTYLQEARIPMMTRLATLAPGAEKFRMVVAQTDVDYLRPMLLRPEAYTAASRLVRVGTKSVAIETEIRSSDDTDSEVHARGVVVMVFFDTDTQRSVAPPESLRELMRSLVVQD